MSDDLKLQAFISPVLHKSCEPVTDIDDDLLDTIGKMFAKMKENNGVGLAANQVGISKAFCVAALEDQTKLMAFINPKIVSVSKEKVNLKEGCLSCPGVMVAKKRHKEIIVECTNIKGEKEKYHLTDFDARILQHEIDHLNGKLCLSDYMGYCDPLLRR